MQLSLVVEFIQPTDLEKSNVIINQTIDACNFLNGTLSNPFASWLFDIIYMFIPKDYLHECNYQGVLSLVVKPIQLPPSFSFIKGIYRAYLKIFNNEDSNIGSSISDTLVF